MSEEWEEDHSKPNPYASTTSKGKSIHLAIDVSAHTTSDGLTEDKVRLELHKDELGDTAAAMSALCVKSLVGLLATGLELEAMQ